jgi:hypothetical protein
MTSCQLLDRPTGPRKGMRIMKRIFALALIVCVGLECGCGSSAKQQQQTNLAASSLVGDWTGTVTGTNFVGTFPITAEFCYEGPEGPVGNGGCFNTGTSVMGFTVIDGLICWNDTSGQGTLVSNYASLTLMGTQIGLSSAANNDWPSMVLNGTVAPGVQSMSGTVSFSLSGSSQGSSPCGTAANPWTGTFTATLQQP